MTCHYLVEMSSIKRHHCLNKLTIRLKKPKQVSNDFPFHLKMTWTRLKLYGKKFCTYTIYSFFLCRIVLLLKFSCAKKIYRKSIDYLSQQESLIKLSADTSCLYNFLYLLTNVSWRAKSCHTLIFNKTANVCEQRMFGKIFMIHFLSYFLRLRVLANALSFGRPSSILFDSS